MQHSISSATVPEVERDAQRVAGRYLLLEELGSGGMGTVHRARDETSDEIVALKQLVSSRAGRKRRMLEALFEREYHTLVRLKHPRIIEVYDYGVTDTGPYYTMELLDGQDLQQLAPLPYKDACRYLRDLASSLALIHAHRLVHRDLSPRNVRLTQDGRAKLIDFGALTAFGPAAEVVGTPLCMAPEIIGGMPLDQRTDFYALGAVGYWALTGQHAYPARRFDELAGLWQRPPVVPSKVAPDVPAALDSLIMSLLSLDPLARPSSAAAVIDQLTAVADLSPEDHDHAAQSYLSSGRMVGRAGEEQWVQKRMLRALQGKGAEVVIEGSAGIGKTRLLHELGLIGQLKGMLLLRADAEASPGFFGVVAVLASNLLAACPDLARRALGPNAALLAHLSPELREKLEQSELLALTFDSSERRARFQTVLHEWFLEVARERTLLIAVDNLQAADEESAAFLAALGSQSRETHLMLLVTQRAGDAVVARAPLQALRKRCSRLKLAGLSPSACEELVSSLFGDVANGGRLARILYEKSGGSPQLCTDLAQLLVKKKIATYAGGTWVLPLEVSAEELPSRIDEILATKLEGLSAGARDLAEALSIHVKPVPIELCLAATASEDERTVLAALDELVAEQILGIEGSCYRFAQEALREAVLGQMDQTSRRARHLRAAEALLATAGEGLEPRMQAGWHLLRGGDEARGADLLASTGRAFLKAQGATESVDHLVQALRTAVEVYERHGRSDYQVARLLFALVPLGYYSSDWRVVQRYGVRAFELGLEITGLSLAAKLRPLMGKKLALKLGLAFAGLRFAEQKKRGLDYDLPEAISAFCGMVPATFATFITSLDASGVARIWNLVEPLSMFDEGQFPSLMYRWAEATTKSGQGEPYQARQCYQRLRQRFQDPAVRQLLGEGRFKGMYGGLLLGYAAVCSYGSMIETLELAREMEGLGVRTWAMSADQIRTLYHAFRGEIEDVRRYRARVELFAVQGSSTWQSELFLPAVLLNADVLTSDTIAARRTWEQLARRAKEIPSLSAYAAAAHAAYLALRGELPAAIASFEKVLPEFPVHHRVLWLAVRGYFGQALNQAGEHARAKGLLTDALSHLDPHDDVIVLSLESRRQLALAEAGLGNRAEAARMLDALLLHHAGCDNPLLVGLLHKARAEVALLMRDQAGFEAHLEPMEQRFRGTRNPSLVAQWETLAQAGARAGLRPASEPKGGRADATQWQHPMGGSRTAAELTSAADRAEHALWLILERSRAKSGYLYLLENRTWRLVAASNPTEPPAGLEAQLRAQCESSRIDSLAEVAASAGVGTPVSGSVSMSTSAAVSRSLDLEDGFATVVEGQGPGASYAPATHVPGQSLPSDQANRTVFIESVPAPAASAGYHLLVLSTSGRRAVVGGVILEVGPHPLRRLEPELLETIARALHERCVTSMAESRG